MNLNVGTLITWRSAAGDCIGRIREIRLAPAANQKVTPWMIVDRMLPNNKTCGVQLCGNDGYLRMMQVQAVQI